MDTYITQSVRSLCYILCSLGILFLSITCTSKNGSKKKGKVYIKEESGYYRLYNNGKVFSIKGAAGYTNLHTLKEIGGNTIRVWDTTNLALILDSARANHLMVIAGLPVFNTNDDHSFYESPDKVNKQYKLFEAIVRRYKEDPAILMWCVGNELPFPNGLSYHNFYKAFNHLTDMIRQEDPDHPITTTISKFNNKYIFNIITRCDVDLISFNIFGGIKSIREDIKKIEWFWKGPYLLLEWGIDGAWSGTGIKQTAWGSYIEPTSQKKSDYYYDYYTNYIPLEDPRFIGSFIFFWGSKQETTHTWFSLFDYFGNKTETIHTAKKLWNPKYPINDIAEINFMLVDGKGATDNILVNANDSVTAALNVNKNKTIIKKAKWEIYHEDWYLINKKANPNKTYPITTFTSNVKDFKVKFAAPAIEGPYRLFATIYDGRGNISTCNVPFYVVSDK